MQLSKKQNEYILHATHRWNIKSGAVRSGKSFVDTAYPRKKRKARIKCDSWSVKSFNRTKCITANARTVHGQTDWNYQQHEYRKNMR